MHRSEREQPETTESSKDRAPESRPQPGLANRTFTAATLAVGFAIIVVMLFATLAPGPRPFLRDRVEVLGSTEATSVPPSDAAPAEAAEDPIDPTEPDITPNDDWNSPLFGVEDTTFGDEPVLDALHARCGDEDHVACDDLVSLTSGTRSPYELWGLTCGNRTDLVTGPCSERFGDAEAPSGIDLGVGTCLALPRAAEGVIRPLDCSQPHDGQLIAQLASSDPLEALDGSFFVGPEALAMTHEVCAATIEGLLAAEGWDYPTDLEPGVIAPTADSDSQLFGCFVWAPGWVLEASLVATT